MFLYLFVKVFQGFWVIEIKLIQYQRPQRVLSSSGGRPREASSDPQDIEMARLTTELNNQLAGEGNR